MTTEDLPHWQRIHFSEHIPVGVAYVVQLEDEREPAKFVTEPTGRMEMCPLFGFPRREMRSVLRRPTVPTLIVNRRTLFGDPTLTGANR